ncbi:MAG: TolC family protein [Rhizobacter sp.]|nr:TolC family protein [Chlorobiales bacterium]
MHAFRYISAVVLIFSAIHVSSTPAFAQARRVTLDQAVAVAMEQNRDLKVAQLELEKSGQQVREAWSNVYPTISGSAQAIHNFRAVQFFPNTIFAAQSPEAAPPPLSFTPFVLENFQLVNATVSIQQPLFQGAIYAGVRAASVVDKLSKESYVGSRASVQSSVKQSYYLVLTSYERVKVLEQSILRNELALSDSRKSFRQGLVADIDTLRAFVAVENLRPQLIQAKNSADNTLTLLKIRMGIPESEQLMLTDSLVYDPQTTEPTEPAAYAEALANRAEVRQLELNVKLGDEQIAAEFAGHLPSLIAVGQLQVLTQTTDLSKSVFPSSLYAGLQLTVPIFQGFKVDSKVQQAVIAKKQTETQLDNLKEVVRSEIRVRLSGVVEARQRLEVQRYTVNAAERSFAITRSRRQQGIGTQLELTDADRSLTEAKTNYLSAVSDYLTAKVNLDLALGRLGRDSDLGTK